MFIVDGIEKAFYTEDEVFEVVHELYPHLGDDEIQLWIENHVSEY